MVIYLDDNAIECGRKTLAALDARGYDVAAALWIRQPDLESWRLGVAFDQVMGPLEGYERIQDVLRDARIDCLRLDEVTLLQPDEPMLKRMGQLLTLRRPGIGGVWQTGNVVDGQMLPDAYVYRLDLPRAKRRQQQQT